MGKVPPGFRFHPTDVELVKYYLKRKVMGRKLSVDAISEIDIYKHAPWDLPDKSALSFGDLKWYFFCPVEKKYARGGRISRATEEGYWKTTGRDRPVLYDNDVVGMIKTLVFHLGKAPRGERMDWVMHEYRLEDKELAEKGVVQDAYVLCVVFKKDGPGPRNGSKYGAPFKEEDWTDDEEDAGPEAVSSVDLCAPKFVISSSSNPVISVVTVSNPLDAVVMGSNPVGSVSMGYNPVGVVATDSPAAEATCIELSAEPNTDNDLQSFFKTPTGIFLSDLQPFAAYDMARDAIDALGGSSVAWQGGDASSMMDIFTEETSLQWNNREQRFEVYNSDGVLSAASPSGPSSMESMDWTGFVASNSAGLTPGGGQSSDVHSSLTVPSATDMTATSHTFLEVPSVSDDDTVLPMLAYFTADPFVQYP